MHHHVKSVLISEEQIEQKSKELGHLVSQDYKDLEEPLILVALLKGSVPFLATLIKYPGTRPFWEHFRSLF